MSGRSSSLEVGAEADHYRIPAMWEVVQQPLQFCAKSGQKSTQIEFHTLQRCYQSQEESALLPQSH